MARFLSAEWLDELGAVVAAMPVREPDGPPAGASLALGQLVTGMPEGDVSYTIFLGTARPAGAGARPDSPAGAGRTRVERGVEAAEVVLVESYETASALAAGELSASDALSAGRIKVRGHAGRLVESEELVTALGKALAGLRAATTY